jgi:predicted enzyme related to lactoylglutathione lyase
MISRAQLLAGPGYITFKTASWRMASDLKVMLKWTAQDVTDALKGPFTKVVTDRWIEVTGTPLYYDPTTTNGIFFPYISLASTPPGTQIFGAADSACSIVGNDGKTITLAAAAITSMPSLHLGADRAIYGPITIIGVPATGTDPSTATSFYQATANWLSNSFTPPAIPATATLARQKWSAVYGADTGWSSFQAFKGFEISHELKLKWHEDNGQRVGATLAGYRAMCKCQPSANTIDQMATEMLFAGTAGVGGHVVASQGQRYSANSADLIISGASSGTVTLKNATMEAGEINFSAEELNQGEVTFITNVGDSSGANVASLLLA